MPDRFVAPRRPASSRVVPQAQPGSAPRRSVLIGLVVAGFGVPWRLTSAQNRAPAAAAPVTPPVTDALKAHLTQATRLSILTDRVTRAQVQRSLGVLVPRAERVLKESTTEARQLLGALRQGGGSPATRSLLNAAAPQVERFLSASDNLRLEDRNALARLAEQADEAGEAVDKVAAGYLLDLGAPTVAILQTTAQLQRLTQHLSVHYLLARAGVQPQEQMKEVAEGRQAFESGVSALINSAMSGQRIVASLGLLDGQWTLLKMALANTSTDPMTLQTVSTTSERTLEVLTELYTLYEAALR